MVRVSPSVFRHIHYSLAIHIVSELYLKGFPGAVLSSSVQNEISNTISELYTPFDSTFQNTVNEVWIGSIRTVKCFLSSSLSLQYSYYKYLLLFESWKKGQDVSLDVLIRASPSGFPSPCTCGIYCNKYLERLIVKIKMKYKIWSKIELILWSSPLDFVERNALKRCGRFFSSLLVFKQMLKTLSASCLFNFFFLYLYEKEGGLGWNAY